MLRGRRTDGKMKDKDFRLTGKQEKKPVGVSDLDKACVAGVYHKHNRIFYENDVL